jgi:hypothetical protein
MYNKQEDALFLLIKSLTKPEKKNFKLYVTRNSKRESLRTVKLFDILERMKEYDEAKVLQKYDDLPKQQLLNIKSLLYNEILSSLRLIREEDNIEMRLREQMDHARILYSKGLYIHSLKILEKMGELATAHQQFSYLQQILFFEKEIETLHITRSMQGRADELARQATEVNEVITVVNKLSNLSLQLYSWFISHGHARNEEDEKIVKDFFKQNLPVGISEEGGFYQQLYLYQSYCWFSFILQDFMQFYRYTQRWVSLFDRYPVMRTTEIAYYIKGLHYLSDAHFYLRNFKKLEEVTQLIEVLQEDMIVRKNEAYQVQVFIYLYTARINRHFIEGSFTEGLGIVAEIESKLAEYKLYLDKHRILIFYYKIACLYFGSGDNDTAIDYLNKIINWKIDLRADLQCYARLLHLIAHYELGSYDLLEYLSKSVYRLMAKMGNLSVVEEEIFKFLKKSLRSTKTEINKDFKLLLSKLQEHTTSHFETRAYSYLDIMSWLESKIYRRPVQDIIKEKYLISNRRKSKEQ